MSAKPTPRWRLFRRLFRWCRICVLLLALAGLLGFLYLSQVDLPLFLKTRLQAGLRAQGVDLTLHRIRWRWYRGILAEAVTVGSATQADGPQLHLGEVAVKLDPAALLRLKLRVRALGIREGRLVVPLHEINQPPRLATLEAIDTELRLLPGDQWELDQFQARFLGAKLSLAGSVTNSSALSGWWTPSLGAGPSQASPVWKAQARQFLDIYQQMQFTAAPDLRLSFRGDARQPHGFTAELKCLAAGAQTPWGSLENFSLVSDLNQPLATNGSFHSALRLRVDNAHTSWGGLREGQLAMRFSQSLTNPVAARVDWDLAAREATTPHASFHSARLTGQSVPYPGQPGYWDSELSLVAHEVQTDWGRARTNQLTGRAVHSLTNLTPREAELNVHLAQPRFRWGDARAARLVVRVRPAAPPGKSPDATWGGWAELAPFQIDYRLEAEEATFQQLSAPKLVLHGQWQAPALSAELESTLPGGSLRLSEVRLEVPTRELRTTGLLAADWRPVAALFGPEFEAAATPLRWQDPPTLSFRGRLVLPAWTNAQPDWRAEVLPTLEVNGDLQSQNLAWREFDVLALRATLSLSNLQCRIPELVVTRPEGEARIVGSFDLRDTSYQCQVRSGLDPGALRPLFGPAADKGFSLFQFNSPPVIHGEVWGQTSAPDRLGAAAQVAATNFVFRGETCDTFEAAVAFTNRFLTATNLKLRHGQEWIDAPAVGFSFTNYWVYLTNAQSQIDPQRVARVISAEVSETIRPYEFARPPRARVNGHVPAKGSTAAADLRFELEGGPFRWWRFDLPELAALVHWQGELVTVTNLAASFYKGKLAGDIALDFTPPAGADFRFRMRFTDTDLHLLLADVDTPTNRLEGVVSGALIVTAANSADWTSWQGFGNARMRDGLLWSVPVFGIFSPILNAIAPGLGNSRASAGKARFSIEHSLIHSDDLEINAGPVRLRYNGTVDFKGNVNARVEAEVLRGTPLLGPLISLAFTPLSKIFAYKVTGTLSAPQTEPLRIPKFLDSILHPFRTLKGVFPVEAPAATPGEPASPPPQ